jgi:hypothetical protein
LGAEQETNLCSEIFSDGIPTDALNEAFVLSDLGNHTFREKEGTGGKEEEEMRIKGGRGKDGLNVAMSQT